MQPTSGTERHSGKSDDIFSKHCTMNKIWALMITTFIYLNSERTINISSYLFIIAVLQRTLFSKEVLSKS